MILHALPQQSEVQIMCLLLSSKIIKISQRMCVEAHNYTATCNLQVSESHQGIQVSVMSTSPVYYSSPVIMMDTLICTELYLLWIWHQKTDSFSDSVLKLHGACTSCEFMYLSIWFSITISCTAHAWCYKRWPCIKFMVDSSSLCLELCKQNWWVHSDVWAQPFDLDQSGNDLI